MPTTEPLWKTLLPIVIDKGILALILVGAGLWANTRLERFKSTLARADKADADKRALENEIVKLKSGIRLQFLERQLSELYWPLLLRVQKDTAMWTRVPALSRAHNPLPEDVGRQVEQDAILPNHEECVKIIETGIHLVQDGELLPLLEQYIRHVAVYRALRTTNSSQNPIDVGEAYPAKLPSLLQRKTAELQQAYSAALAEASPQKR